MRHQTTPITRPKYSLKSSFGFATAITISLLLAHPLTIDRAHAQDGTVKAQHGDWQIVCKKPAGAKKEVCAAVQSVTAEDRPNVGLTVYIQKFNDGKKVLRVFAPLGILLPTGIGLKIDNVDVGHAPFLRCHSFACYAQVTADEELLSKLSTGKTAMFIIFQTEEVGIGIPVSLNGLNTAMKSLK